MIRGEFIDGDKPTISAGIAWKQAAQNPYFILDTGFTGDLVVTPEVARDLGLEITSVMPAHTAANKIVNLPTATAIAVMEGVKLYVTVFISEGWPLLGIGFLQKFSYKATVDCKYKQVSLEVSK
jgi:clan AA aspartic protease